MPVIKSLRFWALPAFFVKIIRWWRLYLGWMNYYLLFYESNSILLCHLVLCLYSFHTLSILSILAFSRWRLHSTHVKVVKKHLCQQWRCVKNDTASYRWILQVMSYLKTPDDCVWLFNYYTFTCGPHCNSQVSCAPFFTTVTQTTTCSLVCTENYLTSSNKLYTLKVTINKWSTIQM